MNQEQIEDLKDTIAHYKYLLRLALKAMDEVYEDEDRRGATIWCVGDVDLINDIYKEIEDELKA